MPRSHLPKGSEPRGATSSSLSGCVHTSVHARSQVPTRIASAEKKREMRHDTCTWAVLGAGGCCVLHRLHVSLSANATVFETEARLQLRNNASMHLSAQFILLNPNLLIRRRYDQERCSIDAPLVAAPTPPLQENLGTAVLVRTRV